METVTLPKLTAFVKTQINDKLNHSKLDEGQTMLGHIILDLWAAEIYSNGEKSVKSQQFKYILDSIQ